MATIVSYTTATSGTVTTPNTNQNVDVIHDAVLTATLTVALPDSPFNGQQVRISSNNGITSLTLTTLIGAILNALTTLGAGQSGTYVYYSATSKWYKF